MTSLSEQHLFYFHMTKSTSKTKGILTCTFFQQHQTGSFKLMSFHNKNFLLELHVKPENEVKVIPGLFTVIFFCRSWNRNPTTICQVQWTEAQEESLPRSIRESRNWRRQFLWRWSAAVSSRRVHLNIPPWRGWRRLNIWIFHNNNNKKSLLNARYM